MEKKILALLIGLFLLVSCSTGNEASPLTATILPTTPTNTLVTSTDTVIPTATFPLATVTATVTPTPSDYVTEANQDGSWYYESFQSHLKIYQEDHTIPFYDFYLFEYYSGKSQGPDFAVGNSPIMALLSDPVWSPDGRYLAFLGAIDGPSSDLYVFDTNSQTVTRLTSGENQAVFPEWAPDSDWIIHGEMIEAQGDSGYVSLWAAKPDGSEIRWLYSPNWGWPQILGWIDQSSFYTYDATICGDVALRLINLETNSVFTAFDLSHQTCSSAFGFGFDSESGAVVYQIALTEDVLEYESWGIYLTTPWALSPRLMIPYNVDSYTIRIENSWDEELGAFVVKNYCDDNKDLYYAITPQGEVFCVEYAP